MAQSAHGADVSHLGRLSHAVLGDRRAAGLRRGRGALARQVRRDLDARLGADRRRAARAATRRAIRCIRESSSAERASAGISRRTRSCAERPRRRPAGKEPDRADWTQPLVFSKADPRALYYASQFLYKTTDGAKSWTQISRRSHACRDPGIPPTLDAAAAAHIDRNGKRGVIYTIAPSPLDGAAWSGSAPTTARSGARRTTDARGRT